MQLILTVLIAFLVVAGLYQVIHRLLVKRATLMVQRQAAASTDAVVLPILRNLVGQHSPTTSQLVADVWGKGVLVFEYIVDLTQLTPEQQAELTQATVVAHLQAQDQAYQVTDWWTYEKNLHIEVAQLSNEATKEYVHDLKKLEQ